MQLPFEWARRRQGNRPVCRSPLQNLGNRGNRRSNGVRPAPHARVLQHSAPLWLPDYLRPPSAAARPGLSNVRVLGRLAFTPVSPISGSSPSTNSTSTRSQRKRRHQANSPSSNSSGCSITSVMTHPGKISTLNPTQTSSGQFTHHPARPSKSPAAFHPVPRNRPAANPRQITESVFASVPPHLMAPNAGVSQSIISGSSSAKPLQGNAQSNSSPSSQRVHSRAQTFAGSQTASRCPPQSRVVHRCRPDHNARERRPQ